MKNKLLLILLIFSFEYVKAQDTLIYITGGSLWAQSIQLNPDSTFEFQSVSCTRRNLDIGTFKKSKQSLVLNFENMRPPIGDSIIVNKTNSKEDSCHISLRIKDINNAPLSFCTIKIVSDKKERMALKSNLEGEATINIEKSAKPIQIEIYRLGFRDDLIKLDNTFSDYSIRIFKNSKNRATSIYQKGDRLRFKIIRENKKWIILKNRADRRKYNIHSK